MTRATLENAAYVWGVGSQAWQGTIKFGFPTAIGWELAA
jgi:hypothetical protein